MFKCFQSHFDPLKPSTSPLKFHSYSDVRLLAEGGYSYVWLAKQGTRKVAIKKMVINSPETLQLARNEIQTMLSLPQHPNLIQLIDYGDYKIGNKLIYAIVTEHCEQTLFTVLRDNQLTEAQVQDYFNQIVDAVEVLHAEGWAHRDLKLENILVKDGICKLADFGSMTKDTVDLSQLTTAKLYEQEELFSKYTTITVRPPEMTDVLMRQIVDQKVDLWQLGCLLYTLCFHSKIAISQALYEIPPSKISIKLITLIRKLLHQDSRKRPTIKELKLSLYDEQEEDSFGEFQ